LAKGKGALKKVQCDQSPDKNYSGGGWGQNFGKGTERHKKFPEGSNGDDPRLMKKRERTHVFNKSQRGETKKVRGLKKAY